MKRWTFDLEDAVAEELTHYIAKAVLAKPSRKLTKVQIVNKALENFLSGKRCRCRVQK